MRRVSVISVATIIFLLFSLPQNSVYGQEIIIRGFISDTTGVPLPGCSVREPVSGRGVMADSAGLFRLKLPLTGHKTTLIISCTGYLTDTTVVDISEYNKSLRLELIPMTYLMEGINIKGSRGATSGKIEIPAVSAMVIPSVTGGVEAVITTLPGVASFSELSSSYSVRGGSYDENLVYINNAEVYRPYLIRTGQQEGLSSINPDLVRSVQFYSGGFNATYGDKMASVLDVQYREPDSTELSVSPGLMLSAAHIGVRSSDGSAYLLAGLRFRSNSALLNSLDVAGHYNPVFADFQAVAGYSPKKGTKVTFTFWNSFDRYRFVPRSRTTTFGTSDNAYRLYAYFEGNEIDRYMSAGGAVSLAIDHNRNLSSKLTLSAYMADERESFDIRGAYSLNALDKTEGSENNPDTLINADTGSWLSHARNALSTRVANVSYRGTAFIDRNRLEWGLSVRDRYVTVDRDEWLKIDSAGYTSGNTGDQLTVSTTDISWRSITSYTSEAFFMTTTNFRFAGLPSELNAGLRASYDSYTSELIVSPRISGMVHISRGQAIYLSAGAYHQPPGARELMLRDDDMQTVIRAQKSCHLTFGTKLDFEAWERPFSFTAEAYFKMFRRMLPYIVDNVRISYYDGNIAEGYSMGADLRVNGEFVPGTESWFSLSFMKSDIRIPVYQTGWYPAPFDQRVNFGIFFRDYLPGHPDFRAHVSIQFGTGIPTTPPGRDPWESSFRLPPYRRIDLGFEKVIAGKQTKLQIKGIKELVAGFEIFNLSDIRNTISYTWIRTVSNSQGETPMYAVPNYLTSRRINLSITARF